MRELSTLEFICESRKETSKWYRIFSNMAADADVLCKEMPYVMKILVIINPFGGRGQGPAIFEKAR